ncbi:mammalian ependymin-related protein 1-like [Dysidea avara]|uniref:mammalian ependymin-related protein 1-like n=1 Tax=Dysidea avara TaxID=196820 RepID=UPI0033218729
MEIDNLCNHQKEIHSLSVLLHKMRLLEAMVKFLICLPGTEHDHVIRTDNWSTERDMEAIILVLLVGLAASQEQICISPPQWEGLLFEFYSTDESSAPTTVRIGKESYDATKLRRRFAEEVDMSRTDREYYDELFLHEEGVGYRLNLKTRECEKFPLHEPWRPVEVPVNTTLENTFYLGSVDAANNYVKMNAYHGYTDRGYYRGSWTTEDCIPYIHSYLATEPTPHYHRMTMMDITLGISDPDVFIPPRECM